MRKQRLFLSFFLGIILLMGILIIFSSQISKIGQLLSGNLILEQKDPSPVIDMEKFFPALQKRDFSSLEIILKGSFGKAKEILLVDLRSFSRIENIVSTESSSGVLVSFFATQKTDVLHPYTIFIQKNGEIFYKTPSRAKIASFLQLTGKSEVLLQNLGPFPWSTTDVWREIGTGEIVRVFSDEENEIVEKGEMMRVEGGLLKNFSLENLDRGFVVEVEGQEYTQ
jgi:hypothetical protein